MKKEIQAKAIPDTELLYAVSCGNAHSRLKDFFPRKIIDAKLRQCINKGLLYSRFGNIGLTEKGKELLCS